MGWDLDVDDWGKASSIRFRNRTDDTRKVSGQYITYLAHTSRFQPTPASNSPHACLETQHPFPQPISPSIASPSHPHLLLHLPHINPLSTSPPTATPPPLPWLTPVRPAALLPAVPCHAGAHVDVDARWHREAEAARHRGQVELVHVEDGAQAVRRIGVQVRAEAFFGGLRGGRVSGEVGLGFGAGMMGG